MPRDLYMDFGSIDDVLEALEQERPYGSGTSSTGHHNDDAWDLGIGWEGAYDAYTGGWAEGAQKAYELAERLIPRPIGKRTALVRSVTGAFPNVGAYLAGAPNAMYRVSKKTAGTRPYVHLYMPIEYMGSINAETAFDRGCALVALADALEIAGCRVRITLTRTSYMDHAKRDRLTMRFEVKGYGERIDVDQLIFTAAHPAMFRRIGFALQERSEHAEVRAATIDAYGYSTDLPVEATEPDGRAILVMFPRLERNGGTPETFLAEMVAALPEELQTEIAPVVP